MEKNSLFLLKLVKAIISCSSVALLLILFSVMSHGSYRVRKGRPSWHSPQRTYDGGQAARGPGSGYSTAADLDVTALL